MELCIVVEKIIKANDYGRRESQISTLSRVMIFD